MSYYFPLYDGDIRGEYKITVRLLRGTCGGFVEFVPQKLTLIFCFKAKSSREHLNP
jgi:hypothetical protein